MKKLIPFICIPLMLGSCGEDPGYTGTSNAVSETSQVDFEELNAIINIKTSDSTYLATSSIDSINIYINNQFWSMSSATSSNLEHLDRIEINNKLHAESKVNYFLLSQYTAEEIDFTTAGDYANYLNDQLDIEPGEYICFIESFTITRNNGSVEKHYPYEYRIFNIEDNQRSVSLGELELNIE